MTEHHNAEEDAYNNSSSRQIYALDNISARDSEEAREEEMFRVMQQEDKDDNRVSMRENIGSQRRSEAPTKPSSPGPAAAVAVAKPILE